MKKVFVFNLDGTLIDSIEIINDCFNHTTQKSGLKPVEKEELNYFLDDGPKILVEKFLGYLTERDSLDETRVHSQFNEIYDSYIEYYNGHGDRKAQLYPRIRENLDRLKEMDVLVYVCTNKILPATEKVLNNLFPQGHSDYVSALEGETKRKPDPYLFEKIVEDSNTREEEIVYFGDTNTNIETCKNAGVTNVGVEWDLREGEELVESRTDFMISDQRGIADFYGELSKSIG